MTARSMMRVSRLVIRFPEDWKKHVISSPGAQYEYADRVHTRTSKDNNGNTLTYTSACKLVKVGMNLDGQGGSVAILCSHGKCTREV